MAGGRRECYLLFNGYRVSTWVNEIFPKMDSDDSCTTVHVYLMTQNCTFKNC